MRKFFAGLAWILVVGVVVPAASIAFGLGGLRSCRQALQIPFASAPSLRGARQVCRPDQGSVTPSSR